MSEVLYVGAAYTASVRDDGAFKLQTHYGGSVTFEGTSGNHWISKLRKAKTDAAKLRICKSIFKL
jgi:hypothetical protein